MASARASRSRPAARPRHGAGARRDRGLPRRRGRSRSRLIGRVALRRRRLAAGRLGVQGAADDGADGAGVLIAGRQILSVEVRSPGRRRRRSGVLRGDLRRPRRRGRVDLREAGRSRRSAAASIRHAAAASGSRRPADRWRARPARRRARTPAAAKRVSFRCSQETRQPGHQRGGRIDQRPRRRGGADQARDCRGDGLQARPLAGHACSAPVKAPTRASGRCCISGWRRRRPTSRSRHSG